VACGRLRVFGSREFSFGLAHRARLSRLCKALWVSAVSTENGRLRIVIEIVQIPERDYPAGVSVVTEAFTPGDVPDEVGATWVGLCSAINAYMRSRGVTEFDCLTRYEIPPPGTIN